MNNSFAMKYRESNHDLHVRLSGVFHTDAAKELSSMLKSNYSGAGRVFLDVRELAATGEGAKQLFKQCVQDLPAERLLFKGELGFQLGRSGSRVLIVKKRDCQCSGACTVCTCAQRAQEARERRVGKKSVGQ